ncbi:MAG: hypothetical protein A4E37_01664 [Methanoregulaceae archaeon PtaB.Bin056]|nr:MAG: hypothetical protein A4E37_01664 [Methanoregulaceae archaeon PtaB.Bin056]
MGGVALKKILITVGNEDAANIPQILKGYFHLREDFGDRTRFTIMVPDRDLDEVVAKIRVILGYIDKNTLVEVYSPDFTIYPLFDEREKDEGKTPDAAKKRKLSPIEKLLDSVKSYERLDADILSLAAVASIVGLVGLFLNNVGIVIGAMLIAPVIGPIYAFALHSATGDGVAVLRDILNIFFLLGSFILFSLIVTWILGFFIPLEVTGEIFSRTQSSPVFAVMAIFLGFATIVALAKGIPDSIAGVAVAAALLPPALVSGISFTLYPEGTLSALVLTLQNAVGLMAGSIIATIVLQIQPRSTREKAAAKTILWHTVILLLILVLLLAIIPLIRING